VTGRRRILAAGLLAVSALFLSAGACHKAKPKPGGVNAPTAKRQPYTPIPPPPTRTLKPGEPTPLPRLPE